jgi:hypothetical protein
MYSPTATGIWGLQTQHQTDSELSNFQKHELGLGPWLK